MRNITLFIGILLLCSTGCVPSLHPIYFEQDVIFDPKLIGLWTYESGESVEISRLNDKSYQIVYTNPPEQGPSAGFFVGRLVNIDGSMFMDLTPKDPIKSLGPVANSFYRSHIVFAHSFVQVIQTEPTVRIRQLNAGWLDKITQGNPQAIQHVKIDRRIILTATTKELQTFLLKHVKTEGAFDTMADLQRKSF